MEEGKREREIDGGVGGIDIERRKEYGKRERVSERERESRGERER